MAELNVATPNIPIITCHELYLQSVLKMHSSFQFLGSVKLLMVLLVFICHLSKLTDFFILFLQLLLGFLSHFLLMGLGGICPATKENEICHFGAVWT